VFSIETGKEAAETGKQGFENVSDRE
jgi:hypothetical protein